MIPLLLLLILSFLLFGPMGVWIPIGVAVTIMFWPAIWRLAVIFILVVMTMNGGFKHTIYSLF